jgi:hypothetical protein
MYSPDQSNDLMQTFMEFIGDDRTLVKFLHNTPTEELAAKIMSEGLDFEHHIQYTSDQVSGTDLVELKYFRLIRRNYGDYTLVLEIGLDLVERISSQIMNSKFSYSEVLSKLPPRLSADGGHIYRLPEQYIKGYFDQKTGNIVVNPVFNPHLYLDIFDENIRRIREEAQK